MHAHARVHICKQKYIHACTLTYIVRTAKQLKLSTGRKLVQLSYIYPVSHLLDVHVYTSASIFTFASIFMSLYIDLSKKYFHS